MGKREVMTDDTVQDRKDIRNSKMSRSDVTELPKWMIISILATLLGVLLLTLLILGKAIPWEPFVVYDYYSTPSTACPLEQVEVYQDIEIKDGWYTMDLLHAESFWENEEGRTIGGSFFEARYIPITERVVSPSNTVRTAPPVPGVWYAGGTGTLEGTRLGFIGVEQEITVKSDESITVKEWDDPTCTKRLGIQQ